MSDVDQAKQSILAQPLYFLLPLGVLALHVRIAVLAMASVISVEACNFTLLGECKI